MKAKTLVIILVTAGITLAAGVFYWQAYLSQTQSTPLGDAFLQAVAARNYKEVEESLQAGVNPNFADSLGRTGLHLASQTGDLQMVELLLRFNAEVDKADRSGMTPMRVAATAGHTQIVRALLLKSKEKSQR